MSNKILVLDDEIDIAEMIGDIIEDDGYTPVIFTSAVDALKSIEAKEHRFNTIVSDIRMPAMTGIEFLIKLNGLGSLTPVIFITGLADPKFFNEAWRCGAFDILEKPVKTARFLAILKSASKFGEGYHELIQEDRSKVKLSIDIVKWKAFEDYCASNHISVTSLVEKIVDFHLSKTSLSEIK